MYLLLQKIATLILFISLLSIVAAEFPQGRLPVKIIDSRTRMVQHSGTVCIDELGHCLSVDSTGDVTFEGILPGLYSLIAWANEYDTVLVPNVQITSGLNKVLEIELVKKSTIIELDKKVVVGRRLDQKRPEQVTSVSRVNNFELSNTAGTGNDINRVLAVQPSTISGMGEGFDNNLYVRGGHSRENVYVVDGISFDNVSHFSYVGNSGGAIGFLNSTLVQSLDFYAGGFPAGMPSRLSSVIDVNLRTGSFIERKHQFDLNMSGIGLTTEGPLFGSNGSYLASVRLVDLRFLKPMITVGGLPRYGDFQLKTVLSPSENQTVKLIGIGAFDHFDEDPVIWPFTDTTAETKYDEYLKQGGGGVSWDIGNDIMRNVLNFTATARYEKERSEFTNLLQPLASNTSKFNITQYKKNKIITDSVVNAGDTLSLYMQKYYSKRIDGSDDQRWRIGLNNDFSLYVGDEDLLNTGVFADYEQFYIKSENGVGWESYEVHFPDGITQTIIPNTYFSSLPYLIDSSLAIKHGGAYLEYVFQRGMFKAVTGLRGDYYTVITDYGVSPRMGMSLTTNSIGTFSLSGGLYYQFPSEFSGLLEDIIASNPNTSSIEVMLNKVELQRNWQAVIGYERQLGTSHLLKVETYLKWYDREYPLESPEQRRYLKLDDPDGKKRAYGFELSFQKKKYDIFYYSLNYSWFNVENKYVDKKWYTDNYSLRNTAGISLGSNFLKHHGVSLRVQFSEGIPYTPAVKNEENNRWYFDPTKEFNSARIDPILSMNLRYSFKVFKEWGNIMGYVEIWNFLNNEPVVERSFNSWEGYRDYRANGILPVAGVTIDF